MLDIQEEFDVHPIISRTTLVRIELIPIEFDSIGSNRISVKLVELMVSIGFQGHFPAIIGLIDQIGLN